jgi:hypothetical protein
MLIAERLTKVYGRTDGGPGKSASFDGSAFQSLNAPNPDTPCKWWNMVRFLPIGSELCILFCVLFRKLYLCTGRANRGIDCIHSRSARLDRATVGRGRREHVRNNWNGKFLHSLAVGCECFYIECSDSLWDTNDLTYKNLFLCLRSL